MWFLFALAATLAWGGADLFYKKGSDESDRYSHLKIAVMVCLVMGVCSLAMIPFAEHPVSLSNILRYSPASAMYILSMIIGYAGLRYLELSIISPVQNASGALSAVVMILFFTFTGTMDSIFEEFDLLSLIGTIIICVAMVALAIVERHLDKTIAEADKKYKMGALALVFPLLYCLFDTLGTAADGIILDENTGLGLGEIDVLIAYGLTFFVVGVLCWLYMAIFKKEYFNPLRSGSKGAAAIFEEAGQIFYVYAMAANPVLAAPMIASYCIVSVLLSRIVLREKLKASQYACVFAVILGIVMLGISEGLAE